MKIALAAEGGFFEDRSLGVELHWGRGGGERLVAEIPDEAATSNPNVKAALDRGVIVELEGPVKASKGASKPGKAKVERPAASGPSFKELQAEAKALGIKAVGVKRVDLEAAIAAAKTA